MKKGNKFIIPRSSYFMIYFHFKEGGQGSSLIISTCNVMKKVFERKL